MENLKYIIESLLFVAEDPLTIEKLRAILETVEAKEIREALQALTEEYDQREGGFLLGEVAGGWQIRSRPEYHEWIKRMLQPAPQRLSKAALETLAIIAYKQPIIRADIEYIRGVDCGGVLRQLMERKLIRVLGRKEIAGRPLIYATTKLFLEMFDLKNLNDLPTPAELAEFGANLDIPPAEYPPEDPSESNIRETEEEIVQPDTDDAPSNEEEDEAGEELESPAAMTDNGHSNVFRTDVSQAAPASQTPDADDETHTEEIETTPPPEAQGMDQGESTSSDDSIDSPQHDASEGSKNT